MQPKNVQDGSRSSAIDHLHRALAHLVRRRAQLGGTMYPDLSLVGYTFLAEISAVRRTRAADLASVFGLDKSTVSRQLKELEAAGFLRRESEQRGRRGYALVVSAKGQRALERETTRIRERLTVNLSKWRVADIANLAGLVDRFIEDMG